MARGRWSRWGRGSCEGYTLDLGSLINYSVTRQRSSSGRPDVFELSSHTQKIDTFPTARDAMDHVENNLEPDMKSVLEDWELYKAHKVKKREA